DPRDGPPAGRDPHQDSGCACATLGAGHLSVRHLLWFHAATTRLFLAAGAHVHWSAHHRPGCGALAPVAGDRPQGPEGGHMNLLELSRLEILRVVVLGVTAVGLLTIGTLAAAAPPVEAKRLGLRGLKRQRALEGFPVWAMVEPLVRWLGARFGGLLSKDQRDDLNRRLALAGDFMGLLPEEVVGFSILSAFAGAGLGYLLGMISGMGTLILFA